MDSLVVAAVQTVDYSGGTVVWRAPGDGDFAVPEAGMTAQ